jgi:hypothetical protein
MGILLKWPIYCWMDWPPILWSYIHFFVTFLWHVYCDSKASRKLQNFHLINLFWSSVLFHFGKLGFFCVLCYPH